jgi:hypothetical protein
MDLSCGGRTVPCASGLFHRRKEEGMNAYWYLGFAFMTAIGYGFANRLPMKWRIVSLVAVPAFAAISVFAGGHDSAGWSFAARHFLIGCVLAAMSIGFRQGRRAQSAGHASGRRNLRRRRGDHGCRSSIHHRHHVVVDGHRGEASHRRFAPFFMSAILGRSVPWGGRWQ